MVVAKKILSEREAESGSGRAGCSYLEISVLAKWADEIALS